MAIVTTRSLTIQIPEEAYAWLENEARLADQPFEELAGILIEEARRVEQFKGIFFRRGGGARWRAVIIGGMDVWEMIILYQAHGLKGMLEATDMMSALRQNVSYEVDPTTWCSMQQFPSPEYSSQPTQVISPRSFASTERMDDHIRV